MKKHSVLPLHRWLIYCVSATLLILAAQSVRLGHDVQHRIEDLSTAATDNLQWTLSQAEVDFLKYQRAATWVKTRQDLPALRRQFDIYYSRIATFRESTLYSDVRQTDEGAGHLLRLTSGLSAQAELIDSPDQALLASVPELRDMIAQEAAVVRDLALMGVALQAGQASAERIMLYSLFTQLSGAVVALLAALVLTSVLLAYMIYRGRRLSLQLMQDTARMEAMVASSLDAILMTDQWGRVTAFNGAAEQIFGYRRDEALGITMDRLVAEVFDPRAREVLDSIPTPQADGRLQLEGLHKSGRQFPVEVSLSVSRAGKHPVLVGFVRDISGRLADEEALRRARDDALSGERAKDNLLTVMSHEMRTPLTGILGALDILSDTQVTGEQRRYLDAMQVSGELLLHHVNDVLELSRLESGAEGEVAQVFDLQELVAGIVDSQQATAASTGNELSFHCALGACDGVLGRRRGIQQILLNLVGNALKFTSEGAVSVDVLRQAGDLVEVSVADTGQGIPEEDLERIFDDFTMLDPSYQRGQEGTGLGLAITQRLVQAMGGEISCESDVGEGSIFSFTVPLPVADVTQKIEQVAAIEPEAGQRLLVIEDNDINRLLLEKMLSDLGHTVRGAAGGAEGLALLKAAPFDLILTDISMPGIDGLEVISQIRSKQLAEGVNVIALTAHAAAEDHARILAAGFSEVLTKPINRTALADVIVRQGRQATPAAGTPLPANGSDAAAKAAPPAAQCGNSDAASDVGQFVSAMGQEKARHFLSEFRRDVLTLDEGLQQCQTLRLSHRREAHRLAGSAAVLGLAELRAAMLAIETGEGAVAPRRAHLQQAWSAAERTLTPYLATPA